MQFNEQQLEDSSQLSTIHNISDVLGVPDGAALQKTCSTHINWAGWEIKFWLLAGWENWILATLLAGKSIKTPC